MGSSSVQIPGVDFMVFFGTAVSVYPLIRDLCAFLKDRRPCDRFRLEIEEKQEELYNVAQGIGEEFKVSIPQIERASLPVLKREFYEGVDPYTADQLYERTVSCFRLMGELEETLLRCAGICLAGAELAQFRNDIIRLNYRIRPLATPEGFRKWALNLSPASFRRLGFSGEMAVELQKFIGRAQHAQLASEYHFEALQGAVKDVLIVASQGDLAGKKYGSKGFSHN